MPAGYQSLVASALSDGTALTNTVTGASIIPASAKKTIFANQCPKRIRIEASGRISTLTAAPGTLTFEVRMGPSSAIIAATSPAFALNTTAKTNVTWRLYWDLALRSIGASTSAAFMHTGEWESEAVIASPAATAGGSGCLLIPASAPAVGTGWDFTVDNILDLQAKWSVANAANSLQVHTYDVYDLGL